MQLNFYLNPPEKCPRCFGPFYGTGYYGGGGLGLVVIILVVLLLLGRI